MAPPFLHLQASKRQLEHGKSVQRSRQYLRSRKVEKPETQLAVVTILHSKSVAQRPHQEIMKEAAIGRRNAALNIQ
jgi:hypothetical protein